MLHRFSSQNKFFNTKRLVYVSRAPQGAESEFPDLFDVLEGKRIAQQEQPSQNAFGEEGLYLDLLPQHESLAASTDVGDPSVRPRQNSGVALKGLVDLDADAPISHPSESVNFSRTIREACEAHPESKDFDPIFIEQIEPLLRRIAIQNGWTTQDQVRRAANAILKAVTSSEYKQKFEMKYAVVAKVEAEKLAATLQQADDVTTQEMRKALKAKISQILEKNDLKRDPVAPPSSRRKGDEDFLATMNLFYKTAEGAARDIF